MDKTSHKAWKFRLLHNALQSLAPYIVKDPATFAESLRMPAEHGSTRVLPTGLGGARVESTVVDF
jgi:hypothetical protein